MVRMKLDCAEILKRGKKMAFRDSGKLKTSRSVEGRLDIQIEACRMERTN